MCVHFGCWLDTNFIYLLQENGCRYRLKIINLSKKSDYIVCDLHHFMGIFESIMGLKMELIDEFGALLHLQLIFRSVMFGAGNQPSTG